jgi:hypothetical protein
MKSQSTFFVKRLLIFLIPLYAVVAFYLITDPFKVIYKYPYFYTNNGSPTVYALNKDYVSVETFLKNDMDYHYNSFIFGSSRSMFYRVADWQKYISSKQCFHFDASSETIFGVTRKVMLLDLKGVKIKNAIFVVDNELLSNTLNSKGSVFIKHPLLSGQNSFLFQFEFFKTFIDCKFLTDYTYYLITHKINSPFGILNGSIMYCNDATNEISFNNADSLIEINPSKYYAEHVAAFYKRDTLLHTSPMAIQKEQKIMLQEIREILRKDTTQYKIIISPLYDQVKFNPEDKNYLDSIFGKQNVYDFSGINDITENPYNYYENSHYLPRIAARILKEIYKEPVPDSLRQK